MERLGEVKASFGVDWGMDVGESCFFCFPSTMMLDAAEGPAR